jgi:microcystin-dependent protein
MKKYLILFGFLVFSFLFADVPVEINYTGFLREFGQPVSGQRNVELKIYTQATGGIPIWSSGVMTVDVSSGVFRCIISPNIDFRDGNFWIETVVNNKIFSPRQKIVPQMFAIHSRTAENLSKKGDIYFVVNQTTSVVVSVSSINVVGKVKEYGYDLLPRGVIVMWSGSIASIPPGWALCDGGTYTAPDGTQVTTPNLRDRFIVGAGNEYSVGATGGEKYHTLTVAEIPSHYHTVDPPATQTSGSGEHSHYILGNSGGYVVSANAPGPEQYGFNPNANWDTYKRWMTDTTGNHSHTVDIPAFNSGSTGGGQPHENRPPYYALAFIMKL